MPIDPITLARGAEWQIAPVEPGAAGGAEGASAPGGGGFGSFLVDKIGELDALQGKAAQSAQDLATGQASDPSAVVMAVEKARLSMQLASQIRTKAVEAVNDIFHTQV
ncbi:MAG TPA: flagellar hook-basal body complex protein FliE [Solirubrobacteraceae bacterium]|jgi:flagellar hook-basal body complex protein FliE